MNELITTAAPSRDIRWQLLTSVAACALLAAVTFTPAGAAEEGSPTVWIELGGHLERIAGKQEPFMPPFLHIDPRPNYEIVSPAQTQRPPRYALGGEGRISFSPKGSDWSLAAAVRYGRSNGEKHLHQQTTEFRQSGKALQNDDPWYVQLTRFGDTRSAHKASHLIVDFMAGRDVGLGVGRGSSSVAVDLGVRFAQFGSTSTTTLKAHPDPFFQRIPQPPNPFVPDWNKYKTEGHHHSYFAQSSVSRSFSGIGPTLSVNGSQSLAGNGDDAEILFDWGANVAVLFGRQKVKGSFQTTSRYIQGSPYELPPPPTHTTRNRTVLDRNRARVVPNLGGFAGISYRYTNAKVSFGYRADLFFGAMDGGLNARKTSDRSFHGPFAKVSIGLGG